MDLIIKLIKKHFQGWLDIFNVTDNLLDLMVHVGVRIILFSFYITLLFFNWKIAISLFVIDIVFHTIKNLWLLKGVSSPEYFFDYIRSHYNKK